MEAMEKLINNLFLGLPDDTLSQAYHILRNENPVFVQHSESHKASLMKQIMNGHVKVGEPLIHWIKTIEFLRNPEVQKNVRRPILNTSTESFE